MSPAKNTQNLLLDVSVTRRAAERNKKVRHSTCVRVYFYFTYICFCSAESSKNLDTKKRHLTVTMINPILVLFGMGHGRGGQGERAYGNIFSFFLIYAVNNAAVEPSAYARMQRTQEQSNSFSISLSLIFRRLRRPSFSGHVSTHLPSFFR